MLNSSLRDNTFFLYLFLSLVSFIVDANNNIINAAEKPIIKLANTGISEKTVTANAEYKRKIVVKTIHIM